MLTEIMTSMSLHDEWDGTFKILGAPVETGWVEGAIRRIGGDGGQGFDILICLQDVSLEH